MPVVFIEAPPGIRTDAKRAMIEKVTPAIDEAYHIGDMPTFLREYPVENVAIDRRLQCENPKILEALNIINMERRAKYRVKRLALMMSLITLALLAGGVCLAQSKNGVSRLSPAALEQMPKDLEIRFALSALPPHLREAATVYVLDPKTGYVLGRRGANGFSCIVERTEWARSEFRDDIYTALCYDEEGSRNHLRVYMDTAAMRAQGMAAEAVKKEIARRFANKIYVAPRRMGLSYMLAPLMRTYPNPDLADNTVVTMSMPHHMIYAPNLTDRDIGGAPPPSPYPFIFEQGPQGYMNLLLGEQEKAKILVESKDLLADLCSYREFLCLNVSSHDHK